MVDSVDMIINCGTQIALHPKQPLIQSERESEREPKWQILYLVGFVLR